MAQHTIPPDLGQRTYAAYSEAITTRTDGRSPMTAWEDLGDEIQAGWTAAGRAAFTAALTGGTR
ncbi:hypothetical protein U5640_36435 [Streptomyces sp. SS7]|uniref:hypothetical protein n=1 Tax=Streptomyces sp. SS7 TaxID=3108485 RepID=UPI0030EDE021